MASAAPTDGASQFYAQGLRGSYAQLKDVDGSNDAVIEDILSRYNSVIRQCQMLIDAQNARKTQISRSNQVSTLLHERNEYINYLQKLMNAKHFKVVVLDENNFLFDDAS